MNAIKAHYDGRVFVPESQVMAEINQEAIVTLLDTQPEAVSNKEHLLSLAGRITHKDYLELERALEETEKVFPDDQQCS